MLRKTARNIAILVSLTGVSDPQTAVSQIFTRVEAIHTTAPQAGCATGNCLPNQVSFGYYHEHWRRWHDDPRGAGVSSPFVGPHRDTPATSLPDPRDETSPSPRQRAADGAAATTQPAPSQPRTSTPSTTPPSTLVPAPSVDLPGLPDNGGATDSAEADSGFFPLPDSPADQDDALPNSLGPDLDTDPLPNDFESDLPSGFEDTPSDDPTGVFDLDDFGQTMDPRQRRYLSSSSRALRRATPYESYEARPAAAWPTRQVAAYEYEDEVVPPPVRTAELQSQAAYTAAEQRELSARQMSETDLEAGRRNPLRRNLRATSTPPTESLRPVPEAPALNQRTAMPARRHVARVSSVPPRAFRSTAPPAPDWRAAREWSGHFPAEQVEEASYQGSATIRPTEPLPLTANDFQPAFESQMVVVAVDQDHDTDDDRAASELQNTADAPSSDSRRNPLR